MNIEQKRCNAVRWLLSANKNAPVKTCLYFILFEENIEEYTFLLYNNYVKTLHDVIFNFVPDNDCVELILNYSYADNLFIRYLFNILRKHFCTGLGTFIVYNCFTFILLRASRILFVRLYDRNIQAVRSVSQSSDKFVAVDHT
tara:strand:+ start:233 stop:661 length:429 start_codon:yes stop_codon:yes gene_type:complete